MKRKMFLIMGVTSIIATSGLGVFTTYATGSMAETNQKVGVSLSVYDSNQVKNIGEWENVDGYWKFRLKDGSYLVNCWIASTEIVGGYYCVGSTGKMISNDTTPDGYIVGEDGLWTASSTVSQKEIDEIMESRIESDAQPVATSGGVEALHEYYESVAESLVNDPEYLKELKEHIH